MPPIANRPRWIVSSGRGMSRVGAAVSSRLDDAPDGNDVDGADRTGGSAPAGLGGGRLADGDRGLFGTAQPLRPGGEALDRERLLDGAARSFAGGAGDDLDAPARPRSRPIRGRHGRSDLKEVRIVERNAEPAALRRREADGGARQAPGRNLALRPRLTLIEVNSS